MSKGVIIIKDYNFFGGKHCETSAFQKLLHHHGIDYSEEMLLGLGGGIGFLYWQTKNMPFPFLGGRNRKHPDFLKILASRVGVKIVFRQTASNNQGYLMLKKELQDKKPALVYGDIAKLPYFASNAHFGGHAFIVFGVDEKNSIAYIADDAQKPFQITLSNLDAARGATKIPFTPKYGILNIIDIKGEMDLPQQILHAIKDCCDAVLNPVISNCGYRGMQKWVATLDNLSDDYKGVDLINYLVHVFTSIELAGTGGQLFRAMYTDFLIQSKKFFNSLYLDNAIKLMKNVVEIWEKIAVALLPDNIAELKEIRNLLLRKHNFYFSQPPNALYKMQQINFMIDALRNNVDTRSLNELSNSLIVTKRLIIESIKCEKEAFNFLQQFINDY